jgi:heterodisulfide reductase subunit A
MTAALSIADSGFEVILVEKENSLGGNLQRIHYLVEGDNPNRLLRDQVNRIISHSRIDVMTSTVVEKHDGHVGAYHAILRHTDGSTSEISHGVTIVATGGTEARVQRYLLGEHPAVITQLELENKLAYHLDQMTGLKDVVMVQCVKPEDETYEYCSRICCTSTIKNAIRLKLINPECNVTVLYKDIITYGFREQYYTEARESGVIFARYDDHLPPEVGHDNGQIIVSMQEKMIDRKLVLKPDLLVLSTSIVPSDGIEDLSKILNVPLSNEGFFLEAHIKMRPMDFMEEGIFICGIAHYPKFIEESISQAQAAAGRATTILSKKSFHYGGTIAIVDADKCVGCLTCMRTCPFEIPRVTDEYTGVGNLGGAAYIEATLCHGCGTCTAECPANAIQLLNYTDDQIMVPEFPVLGSWIEL